MVFTGAGLLLGPKVFGVVDPAPSGETVKLLAEATLAVVLFGDAARIDLKTLREEIGVPARLLGIGLPLTIGAGLRRRTGRLRRARMAGGAAARRDPRADGCGPRPGRGDTAEPAVAGAAGAQRRERAQRRPLRPHLRRRSRRRDGRGRDRQRRACVPGPRRADRLRHAGRRRRRRAGCRRRRGRRSARLRPGLLAPGRAGGGGGARIHVGDRARRLGLHRRVRRRRDLRRAPPPGRWRGRLLVEELGALLGAATFVVFGAVLLEPALDRRRGAWVSTPYSA